MTVMDNNSPQTNIPYLTDSLLQCESVGAM